MMSDLRTGRDQRADDDAVNGAQQERREPAGGGTRQIESVRRLPDIAGDARD
jgi:hypothetical protein